LIQLGRLCRFDLLRRCRRLCRFDLLRRCRRLGL
jgi:hypothetical protein